jgi:hypothetical protein
VHVSVAICVAGVVLVTSCFIVTYTEYDIFVYRLVL